MRTQIKSIAAATVLGAAMFAAPALANNAVFEFEIHRASLSTQDGLRAEYDRLNDEAEDYCKSLDLPAATQVQICQRQVVTGVVRESRIRELTQLHTRTLRRERPA
jgi:UrcA family protein